MNVRCRFELPHVVRRKPRPLIGCVLWFSASIGVGVVHQLSGGCRCILDIRSLS